MNKPFILALPPNRTRRNYRGGAMLDAWEGHSPAADGQRPEDWIASTTAARNPGLEEIPNEGLAMVDCGDGPRRLLRDVFMEHPGHFLGRKHFEQMGPNLGFLAKLLDAGMRLHVQAHPTREFARKYLNSRWGKLETYVILGCRDGLPPYIRLGFQSPPTPAEWRRMVLEQDIAAMDACFTPIPVAPGETWVVPGGLPHAIGEGLLVMEVMEPTDLVVRCEFEREGMVVPPAARYMGRDPDFALGIFDFTPMPAEKLRACCRITPKILHADAGLRIEQLIGPEQTDCFQEMRIMASAPAFLTLAQTVNIGIVTQGGGMLVAGREALTVRRGSKFLVAAAANGMEIRPAGNIEVLLIRPGGLD